MASVVMQQLDRFGPAHCERLSQADARAWTRRLAESHYENFTVVSKLLPKRLREHFAAVYAFCRWADDLGDETGDPAESLRLLGWWRDELGLCYTGRPRHPVFVALEPTVRAFEIPSKPFEDLISAFEQDQTVHRYETWEQVVDYCTRSADPVGRLVLYMCGHADAERQRLSDRTCTALQLVNFWQDVRRDIVERDRVYVPAEALAEQGLTHDDLVGHVKGAKPLAAAHEEAYARVIEGLLDRTEPMFAEGRGLWAMIGRDMRLPIKLFTLGGEAVARSIRKIGYDTLDRRPAVGRATKLWLMARAMVGKVAGA